MAADDEGFLSRWSRLKRTGPAERSEGQGAAAPRPAPEPAPPAAAAEPAAPEPAPEELPELPDIATLTRDSDFTVFLRDGVPQELRRQALRVLWRSDPLLANLDGLNDYDGDFRTASAATEAIKTAWKIGKGFVEDTPEVAAEAETETAQAPDGEPPAPDGGGDEEAG